MSYKLPSRDGPSKANESSTASTEHLHFAEVASWHWREAYLAREGKRLQQEVDTLADENHSLRQQIENLVARLREQGPPLVSRDTRPRDSHKNNSGYNPTWEEEEAYIRMEREEEEEAEEIDGAVEEEEPPIRLPTQPRPRGTTPTLPQATQFDKQTPKYPRTNTPRTEIVQDVPAATPVTKIKQDMYDDDSPDRIRLFRGEAWETNSEQWYGRLHKERDSFCLQRRATRIPTVKEWGESRWDSIRQSNIILVQPVRKWEAAGKFMRKIRV